MERNRREDDIYVVDIFLIILAYFWESGIGTDLSRLVQKKRCQSEIYGIQYATVFLEEHPAIYENGCANCLSDKKAVDPSDISVRRVTVSELTFASQWGSEHHRWRWLMRRVTSHLCCSSSSWRSSSEDVE